ncbi:MAG: hypothetical protein RL368_1970 [Pseudomonadota bacterium]|jgi:hypothetical protein
MLGCRWQPNLPKQANNLTKYLKDTGDFPKISDNRDIYINITCGNSHEYHC